MEPALVDKKSLMLVIIRNIFFGVNGTIVALALKNIIDGIEMGKYTSVWNWLIIMAVFYLGQDLPQYYFRNAGNKWYRSIKVFLYNRYFSKYFTADNNTMESMGTGKLQNILIGGITSRQNILNSFQATIRRGIAMILGFSLIAANIGWKGFSLVGLLLIGSFIFVQYGNKIVAKYRKGKRDLFTEMDKRLVKMIMSKNEILLNNKIELEVGFIKPHYDKINNVWLKESRKNVQTFDLQRIVFTMIRIGILRYAILQIKSGAYGIGTLALLYALVSQIYGSIEDINDSITQYHQDKVNVDKLRELFKTTPQIKGYSKGHTFIPSAGEIELRSVTYNYGKGEVLENLSLSIEGGKKTALIGVSGSGKSTIIKLIAGYLYPQRGAVKIDNQELPNPTNSDYVSLSSYYKHIGYLTQEPSVFDGTIYENLTYALDHEPSEDEIQKAILGAQCQFINEFPEGVQTQIGEKGIKLSGGQRQRLAIAKVFLKNPTIVLLDEPTSALDSFSEEEVSKAFNNLFTGRTVIIIAHRLQTVKNADRIIVLEKGQVIEEGNHNSLVESGGIYAKMLELQSGF